MVVDDHPAVQAAVAAALQAAGMDVLALASDGEEALAALASHRPDVVVLDLLLPNLTGPEVAQRAATLAPQTRIVVYVGDGADSLFGQALRAGARGFVRKDAPLEELVDAVESVAAGDSYIDRRLASMLVHVTAEAPTTAISEREREILGLLASGRSNADIARALHISPETVRTYIRRAMGKLEAETRTQAVATALRLHLIE